MLKEIAIFIGIFLISIAIYLLYSPSKSGLAVFPTNIGFGFVLAFIGFLIVVVFITLPWGRKKKGREPKTMEEIASELDGPIKLFQYLYQDFAYRFKGTSDYIERKKLERTRNYLFNILKYLKRAQIQFSQGKYGMPELEQAISQAEEFPYGVNTSKGKNVKILDYMNALFKKFRDFYTESKIERQKLEAIAR